MVRRLGIRDLTRLRGAVRQAQGFAKAGFGLVEAAQQHQGITQIIERFCEGGIPPEDVPKALDRLVEPPGGTQDNSQVILRFRIIRLQPKCPPAGLLRLGQTVQRVQGECCIAIVMRIVVPAADRPAEILDRHRRALALEGHHAEQVQRIGVGGIDRQNLAIGDFSLIEPSGLMAFEPALKYFGL